MTTLSPLELFRRGHDYVQIANLLKTTEAEVEKQIHAERKAIRENRGARRVLIPYAGAERRRA